MALSPIETEKGKGKGKPRLNPCHPRGVSKNRNETNQGETSRGGEDRPRYSDRSFLSTFTNLVWPGDPR